MKFSPKVFGASLLAATLLLSNSLSWAYPDKVINWVVPYSPGGSADVVSRVLTNRLAEKMHATFVVNNKPGASALIGEEYVARAAGDGYTLLYDAFALATNPALMKDGRVKPETDFVPITQIVNMWSILVVPENAPYRTFAEFLDYARKNPGKLNIGVSAGSAGYLASELLKSVASINLVTVPYKGGAPAVQATVAGDVSVYFATAGSGMPFIKSGQLRPIAVAAPKRMAALPDVPTLTELGYPDLVVSEWAGLFAPKGTPDDVVQLLNKEIRAVLAEPKIQEQLVDKLGIELVSNSPQEFSAFVKGEITRWGDLIKKLNITVN